MQIFHLLQFPQQEAITKWSNFLAHHSGLGLSGSLPEFFGFQATSKTHQKEFEPKLQPSFSFFFSFFFCWTPCPKPVRHAVPPSDCCYPSPGLAMCVHYNISMNFFLQHIYRISKCRQSKTKNRSNGTIIDLGRTLPQKKRTKNIRT